MGHLMKSIHLPITAASSLVRAFPGPRCVGCDTVIDGSYRYEGRKRKSESGLSVFQYSLAGCGRISVGGVVMKVPAGTGFLCELCDPRIVYYFDALEEETPWEFMYIVFQGTEHWVHELNAAHRYVYALPESDSVLYPFRTMLKRGSLIHLGTAEGLDMTAAFFSRLCRVDEKSPSMLSHHLVDAALEAMHTCLHQNKGTAQIAAMIGVSSEHLCRIFRSRMGVSPLVYFHRQKIRYACTLLLEKRLTNKEIGHWIGMENVSNFTRFFKRHIGLTPGAFRAQGTLAAIPTDLW